MPELPEVEIVRRGLSAALDNQIIKDVRYNRADIRFPLPPELPAKLRGQRMRPLLRRGKYILGFAENAQGFVLHLGMSGVMKVLGVGEEYSPQKHDHVVIEIEGGGRVVFNDARRFGFFVEAHESVWEALPSFKKMGPEPLGNSFSGEVLCAALLKRNAPIKTALLDQSVVAGVGNIYACEALYRAGISPLRPASSLKGREYEALALAIRTVLEEAIEAGGSSLRDYRNTKGKMGYFQHHFDVYDRAGTLCDRCATGADDQPCIERIVQGGRSTFYCGRTQN